VAGAGNSRFGLLRMLLPSLSWTRLLACALLSVPLIGLSQDEIAPFKLTDVSGDFRVGYTLDDRVIDENFTTSNLWREELFFRTRSYIYHPAMLDMQIDGGLEYVQDSYKTQAGSNRETELLFNYDMKFNFLDRKRYPFTVYLIRQHPDMITNLLGRFLVRSDTYGANGRLMGQGLLSSLIWDFGHESQDGSGFGSTIDQDLDRARVSTTLPYLGGQSLRLDLNWFERLSRSGSAGLPIQESMVKSLNGIITAKNKFGDQKYLNLGQSLRVGSQITTTATVTEIDRLQYRADLRWRGSERNKPYLTYIFHDEDRRSTWSRSQQADLGTTFRVSDRFEMTGRGNYLGNRDPGFSRDRRGISATAIYRIPLSFGNLRLTGSMGTNRNDQEAAADTIEVFDERVTLVGTVPVPLNNTFVLEETVVVTNFVQTQTFVEDLDYRLVTIGSTTTIERIITGAILDGQEVLVSYEFRTGGTTAYRDDRQRVGVNLGFIKYFNVFANWSNVDNSIISGDPTVPLNDVTSLETGLSVDVGFATSWSVGGKILYRRSDETISSAVGTLYTGYLNSGAYRGLSAKLGISREFVDNEFSSEDRDLSRYVVGISWRLPGSAKLTYSYSNGENEGGSVTSKDEQQQLHFDWRYRFVIFTLRASKNDTEQGLARRETSRVTAEVRRIF
jgi:hypothetical protein